MRAGTPGAADRAEQLAVFEAGLVSAHKGEFPPAKPAVAPPHPPVDEAAIRRRATGEALAGISLFAFGKRVEAKDRARAVAQERISQARDARAHAQAEEQARLDEEWRLLQANDPATVLEELEASFDDNEAPAVPIDCAGDAVSIVMLYPSADQIPEQKAALTPTGRPTVHKRSKTERNGLHVQGMASHILATIREAFAIAPAINRAVVLTVETDNAVGGIAMLRAVAATGFDRHHVERFSWDRLDPVATVEAANPSLINRRGRTGELAPLDLSDEPDIATVLVTCAALLGVDVDPRVHVRRVPRRISRRKTRGEHRHTSPSQRPRGRRLQRQRLPSLLQRRRRARGHASAAPAGGSRPSPGCSCRRCSRRGGAGGDHGLYGDDWSQ